MEKKIISIKDLSPEDQRRVEVFCKLIALAIVRFEEKAAAKGDYKDLFDESLTIQKC